MVEFLKDTGECIKEIIDDAKSMINDGFSDLRKGFKDLRNWLWIRDEADKIADNVYADTGVVFDDDTLDELCEELCEEYKDLMGRSLKIRAKDCIRAELEKRLLNSSEEMLFTWYSSNNYKTYSK